MKKLLNLLALLILVPSSALVAVGCAPKNNTSDESNTDPQQNVDVQTTLDNVLKTIFANETVVQSTVVSTIEALEGIESVTFTWLDQMTRSYQHQFEIEVVYASGYEGQTLFVATATISEDLSATISTKISEIAKMYFSEQSDAETMIISTIKAIEGVQSVEVTWTSAAAYRLSITPASGYHVADELTGSVRFNDQQDSEIGEVIAQLQARYFDDSQAAEQIIRDLLNNIPGISVTDFEWTNQNASEPSFSVNIEYAQGYSGAPIYSGTVHINTNLTEQIETSLTTAVAGYFETSQAANDAIVQAIQTIQGVSLVSDSLKVTNTAYEFAVTYAVGYTGSSSYSGTIHLNVNITQQLETVLQSINQKHFESTDAATTFITSAISGVEGVSLNGAIVWEGLAYHFSVTYANGYTGNETYTGTIQLKAELTSKIISALQDVNMQYFDDQAAANAALTQALSKIDGVTLTGAISWENTTYILNATYDDNYFGDAQYKGTIKGFNTDATSSIQAAIDTFASTTFDSKQEAIDAIVAKISNLAAVKTIANLDALVIDDNNQFIISIEYNVGYVGNASFTGKIAGIQVVVNLNDAINRALNQLALQYYADLTSASEAITTALNNIKGVHLVGDIQWNAASFTIAVTYDEYYQGDGTFTGSVHFKTQLEPTITSLINNIASQYYDTNTELKTQLHDQLAAHEGIVTVSVTISDGIYTIDLTYADEYQGLASYSGTVHLNQNINEAIKGVLALQTEKNYDSTSAAETAINTALHTINGINSTNFVWTNASYRLTITYQNGYTGDAYFDSKVILNVNNTKNVQDVVKRFAQKYYDNTDAGRTSAQQDVISAVTAISGVDVLEHFTWNNASFSFDITYKFGYIGETRFEGKIIYNTNLDYDIQQALDAVEARWFDTTELATQALQVAIGEIEGVSLNGDVQWTGGTYTINVTYATGYTGGAKFTGIVQLNANLDNEINGILAEFSNIYYVNAIDASTAIKQRLAQLADKFTLNGDLQWTNNQYSFKVKYAQGFSGSISFSNQVLFKTNQNTLIRSQIAAVTANYYTDLDVATNDIVTRLNQIDGVHTSAEAIQWEDNNFTVGVQYENAYTGDASFSGTVKISTNISANIIEAITRFADKYYNDPQDVEAQIINAISLVNGVIEVSAFVWSENIFSFSVKYGVGYTGDDSYTGSIKLNANISQMIQTNLLALQGEKYDDEAAAEQTIEAQINAVAGVDAVGAIVWTLNNYTVDVTYAVGYTGASQYQGSIKEFNRDSSIAALQSQFEAKAYNQFQTDDAKNDVASLFADLSGVTITSLSINDDEVSLALAFDEGFTGTTNWTWKINRQELIVAPIVQQNLSFRTGKTSGSVNIGNLNLFGLGLKVQANDSNLNVSLNATNQIISFSANNNVVIKASYQVDIIIVKGDNSEQIVGSFNVELEGAPRFNSMVSGIHYGFKARKGAPTTIQFTMDYFDPSYINQLELNDVISGNKITSSISHVSGNIYQITYTPNANASFSNGEFHDLKLSIGGFEITTFNFSVYETSTLEGSVDYQLPPNAEWDWKPNDYEINLPENGSEIIITFKMNALLPSERVYIEMLYRNETSIGTLDVNGNEISNNNLIVKDLKVSVSDNNESTFTFVLKSKSKNSNNVFKPGYQRIEMYYIDNNGAKKELAWVDIDVF